jgi:hypothetical protein
MVLFKILRFFIIISSFIFFFIVFTTGLIWFGVSSDINCGFSYQVQCQLLLNQPTIGEMTWFLFVRKNKNLILLASSHGTKHVLSYQKIEKNNLTLNIK